MPQPVLEAALKPAAEHHPYLPVPMWTVARRLAALVSKYRGAPADGVVRVERLLSGQDFMFRRRRPADLQYA